MNVLVSACLMGFRCRYDGGAQRLECLDDLRERHVLIPVCPEVMAACPPSRALRNPGWPGGIARRGRM